MSPPRSGSACDPFPPLVEKVLGLSLAEVTRDLPRLAADPAHVRPEAPDVWRLGSVRITLRPLPPHRLGALAVPRTAVNIDLAALPPEGRAAFLARFERLFFRAGG